MCIRDRQGNRVEGQPVNVEKARADAMVSIFYMFSLDFIYLFIYYNIYLL